MMTRTPNPHGGAPRSTIALRTPRNAHPLTQRQPRTTSGLEGTLHRAKILIVDDEKAHVDFLIYLFEQNGYPNARGISDPLLAVSTYHEIQPDLIVLDLHTPGLGGIQVLRQLRGLLSPETYLPILVVTGDLAGGVRREALARGANDFVIKPYQNAELLQRASNLIHTRFLHCELSRKRTELEASVEKRTAQLSESHAALRDKNAERAQVEQALRESTARFRLLYEKSPVGMAITDMEGRYLEANAAFCALLGHTEEEVLGHRSVEFTHPEDIAQTLKSLREARDQDRPVLHLKKRYVRKDGVIVWSHVTAILHLDEAGRPAYYFALMQDITAQALGEEALQRIAGIVEYSHDAILSKLLDGTIVSWNPAAEKVFGYTAAEAIGASVTMLIPSDRAQEEDAIIERLKRGEVIAQYETVRLRKDGTLVPVSLTISAMRDSAGQIVGASKIARDITARRKAEAALREVHDELESRVARRTAELTAANERLRLEAKERKQAEEALRASEARYQRIAANAPGMVYQFVRRPDGSVAFPYVSEGCRGLFGIEPAEIEADAHVLISQINPADLAGFAQSVDESARALRDWRWEGRFSPPSGGEIWVQGASRPELQPNGDILWDGLLMDITEGKRVNAALRESEGRFRQLAESISDVFWMASADGNEIIYVSPAYEKVWGASCDDLKANPWRWCEASTPRIARAC